MEQGLDARRYIRSYYSHERTPDPFSTLWQTDGPPRSPEPQGEEGPRQEADSFATTVVDDDAPPSTAGLASPLDQELRDARNILERLARRGDVGDDFWASGVAGRSGRMTASRTRLSPAEIPSWSNDPVTLVAEP